MQKSHVRSTHTHTHTQMPKHTGTRIQVPVASAEMPRHALPSDATAVKYHTLGWSRCRAAAHSWCSNKIASRNRRLAMESLTWRRIAVWAAMKCRLSQCEYINQRKQRQLIFISNAGEQTADRYRGWVDRLTDSMTYRQVDRERRLQHDVVQR